MISLRSVPFETVQQFFVDFQKKSHCYEMPPDTAEYVGAFSDSELVGYFILQGYEGVDVEINQGYLKKEYRHNSLSKEFMTLLENMCKEGGYKRMLLGTHNRFSSYMKFAKNLGYKPSHLVFHKEL